jgi:hypothetical protein
MKPVLALIALAIVALPSAASAAMADECGARGGRWVSDPIGSMDSGLCLFALVTSGKVTARYQFSSDSGCRAAGGEIRGTDKSKQCALSVSATRKYIGLPKLPEASKIPNQR